MNFDEFKGKYIKTPVKHFPNNVLEDPVVSVCVQTYQHADYIEDCLEGILMQETDFTYEILLGEDASSDGTRGICIEYAEKYPDKIRLFLHSRENNIEIGGQATGRFNFLYNLYSAKGKYIALCEGDDYWTDSLKLQKQYNFLKNREDFSFCYHLFQLVNNEGKILKTTKQDVKIMTHTKKDLRISSIPTMSMFFKKAFLQPIRREFVEDIPWGDVCFKTVLAKNGLFARMGFVGANKRAEGGVTDINLYTKYKKSYLSLYHTSRIVQDEVLKDILNRRMKKMFWIYLFKSIKSGDLSNFIKVLKDKVSV